MMGVEMATMGQAAPPNMGAVVNEVSVCAVDSGKSRVAGHVTRSSWKGWKGWKGWNFTVEGVEGGAGGGLECVRLLSLQHSLLCCSAGEPHVRPRQSKGRDPEPRARSVRGGHSRWGPALFPSPFTFPGTSPDCELPATGCHHVACGGAGLRSARGSAAAVTNFLWGLGAPLCRRVLHDPA